MVVDKYVGRCLDVGSTPTGSIIPLHSIAFLGKTLLNQRFLFLSLVFLGILLHFFAFLGKTLLNQRFLFLPLVFLSILLRKECNKGVTNRS